MSKQERRGFKGYAVAMAAVMIVGFCMAVFVCFRALTLPQTVLQANGSSSLKIVIDAGHGGIDGGVVGVKTGQKESDVNLKIAFLLKERFTDAGFSVTMTRVTEGGLYDTTAPGFKRRDMQRRREICESASPTCVLSIHQNFYPSSGSRGGQTFYLKSSEESKCLATGIQEKLNVLYAQEGVRGRQQMAADYYMLKLSVPSVIVECGFLSNPKDDLLIADGAFCQRLSDCIFAGVLSGLKALSSS